ncbi:MAG: HPF/RaiA family ribosome-associated protein [Mycoplasmoidaceae bacterium]
MINIRWKDMDKDENIEKILIEKIKKIFEFKFVEENVKAQFSFYKSHNEYELKLLVNIHDKGLIESKSKSNNLEEIIHDAIYKIIDQLRKHKTKITLNKH